MPPSGSVVSAPSRRHALVVTLLVLCCLGTAPALIAADPADPGVSPTAPVETPAPERGPDGPVHNATPTVATPAPSAPVDPGLRDGSDPVRTAVEEAEHLEAVPEPTPTASTPSVHLGPPPSATPATPTDTRAPTATATPEAAATASTTADQSLQATASPTASGGTGGCAGCGVVPVGVVLVGLAGGAGAAASLGLTPPQPPVGHSLRTVRDWAGSDAPRLLPLLLGRFGRTGDTDPLDHTHRQTLRDIVDDRPGVHLGGVVDQVSLSRSSIRHHVRVLEEEGELETAKVLGRRRLFPPGVDSELVAALADEGSRRVVRAVVRVEPAVVGEVVDEADRAYSTVSYHLDRLEGAGAVTRERDGREVTVRLTDEAAALLAVEGDVAAD